MGSEVTEVTSETLDRFVKSKKLALIDCWAEWCMPCRRLSPILAKLATEMGDQVAFGKLDVDDNQKVARNFGIMGIPAMLIFNNGNLVDKIVGVKSKRYLAKVLKKRIESL